MGNVLRVFKRDVIRLLKAPAALTVVVFLVVLPSLYTWFNVIGFGTRTATRAICACAW